MLKWVATGLALAITYAAYKAFQKENEKKKEADRQRNYRQWIEIEKFWQNEEQKQIDDQKLIESLKYIVKERQIKNERQIVHQRINDNKKEIKNQQLINDEKQAEKLNHIERKKQIEHRQLINNQNQLNRFELIESQIQDKPNVQYQKVKPKKQTSKQIKLKQKREIERQILDLFEPPHGRIGIWKHLVDLNENFGNIKTNYLMESDDADYKEINDKFNSTTQKHFKVLDIKRIANPYLQALYSLRMKEYDILYGKDNVYEESLFHGTKFDNVKQIVKYNFDWRLHGKSLGHIFGQGVSFAPKGNYASNYCDTETPSRYMICTYVLVSDSCVGNKHMIIPPLIKGRDIHYDTSEKKDGEVVVKYRDDEFYPAFLIEFSGFLIKKKHRRR